VSPGFVNTDEPYLYTFHDITIQQHDWVVRPALDANGKVIQPLKIKERHIITSQFPMRLDLGRIEYWKFKLRRVLP
jgi:hypothetical protein